MTTDPSSEFKLKLFAQDLLGDRDSQQDYHEYWYDEQGALMLVADGAGGHQGGAQAAQILGKCAGELWQEQRAKLCADAASLDALEDCLQLAHARIIRETGDNDASRSGKAAVVLAYVDVAGMLYATHVGDCRLYVRRGKEGWQCLTRDDSMLQVGLDLGTILPEEARNHPDQNILTQALGGEKIPCVHRLETSWKHVSALLLCCDGFWGQLPRDLWNDEDFLADPDEALLSRLVSSAYDDAKGKSDNISVVMALLPALKPQAIAAPPCGSSACLLLGWACTLGLLAAGGWGYSQYQDLKRESQAQSIQIAKQSRELTMSQKKASIQRWVISQYQYLTTRLGVNLTVTRADLEKTRSDLAETQTTLEETAGALSVSEASLVETKETLASTQATLSETKVTLGNTQTALSETKTTLGNTQTTLSETKAELTNTQMALFETKAELTSTQTTLSEAKAELTSTQTALSETKAELTSTQTALSETKDKLTNTQKTLSETKVTLTSTQAALAEKLAALSATQNTLSEAQRALAALRVDYSKLQADLKEQSQRNEALRVESQNQLQQQQKQLQQLKQRLDEEARRVISFPARFQPTVDWMTEVKLDSALPDSSLKLKEADDPMARAVTSHSTRLGMSDAETPRMVRMSQDGRFLLLIYDTGALVMPHDEGSELLIEEQELPVRTER